MGGPGVGCTEPNQEGPPLLGTGGAGLGFNECLQLTSLYGPFYFQTWCERPPSTSTLFAGVFFLPGLYMGCVPPRLEGNPLGVPGLRRGACSAGEQEPPATVRLTPAPGAAEAHRCL